MVIDHLQGEACVNAYVEKRFQVLFALLLRLIFVDFKNLTCGNGFENTMH